MKRHWLTDELAEFWSLSSNESALLKGRTDTHRLGFALL